ncbi:MAG TPA: zinc ribbon domain-containing protein, partial [Blastocatellia bacterium]
MCATPLKTAAPITSPEKIEQEATNIVQDIACPRCQAMNEAGWSFCQNCGGRLPQVSQQPPEPVEQAPRARPVEREAQAEPQIARNLPGEAPPERAQPADDDMLDAAPPTVVAPALPPPVRPPSRPSAPDLRTVPDQRWVQ